MLTRSESTILKGLAILIMLYLHLFSSIERVELTTYFIKINNVPLVYLLSRFTSICVSLYIILGGYGLFISWTKNPRMNNKRRILLLFINLWIITLIFIPLGSFINPDVYPGNFGKIISNLTGWHTTYNAEWWFLFPYVIVILLSPYIFRLISKYSALKTLLVTGILYLISISIISINQDTIYSNRLILNLILPFQMLFPFSIGAIMAKGDATAKFSKFMKKIKHSDAVAILLLVLVIISMIITPFQAPFAPFMAAASVVLASFIRKPKIMESVLLKLGEHSTNMWLVHTFFCYYLFKDFIYGFKYPLIIFLVLIVVSYATSVLVSFILKPVQGYVNNRLSDKR